MNKPRTPTHRLCFLLLVASLDLLPFRLNATPSSDTVLAAVNSEPITFSDIENDSQNRTDEQNCRAQYQGDERRAKLKAIRLKTLDRLIEERLIIDDFTEQGGFIPDSYIDARVQDIIDADYGGSDARLDARSAILGETRDDFRNRIIKSAILNYMTSENIDKKITSATPDDEARQRAALRQAWLASLRKKAYVKILFPGG